MERNLWISHEALEEFGKEYFENCEADDFYSWKTVEGKQENGLYVYTDDMDDVYVALNEDDECFTNVNEL